MHGGDGIVEDQDFLLFINRMKQLTGIDLAAYKEAQMKRRLTTLRMKHGYTTFAAYFDMLKHDGKLMDEFLDRMTINVSEFWRNPVRWEMVERRYFPELSKESPRLKIWSAACSTGEEPYTAAMILDRLGLLDRSTIIATDIDAQVLEKAKQGLYVERSLKDVPASYKPYFQQEGSMYRVAEKLKRPIRFEKHNLLLDRYGEGYDLIICRNVMIYFTEEAKQQLYHRFSAALRPGGLLFVGSTEQIFSPAQYQLASEETFFYRKTRQAHP